MHTEDLDSGVEGHTQVAEYIKQGCCSQTLSTQSSKSAEDSVEHLRIQRLECNWDIATLGFTDPLSSNFNGIAAS